MNTTPDPTRALEVLVASDEDSLLEILAMRVGANAALDAGVMSLNPTLTHDSDVMGPLDGLREAGRRVLKRWNRELHGLACGGTDEDGKDRDSLLEALGGGNIAFAGAITAVLIGSFGVAPAIATVIGALVVKKLGTPAAEELCAYWSELIED